VLNAASTILTNHTRSSWRYRCPVDIDHHLSYNRRTATTDRRTTDTTLALRRLADRRQNQHVGSTHVRQLNDSSTHRHNRAHYSSPYPIDVWQLCAVTVTMSAHQRFTSPTVPPSIAPAILPPLWSRTVTAVRSQVKSTNIVRNCLIGRLAFCFHV